MRIIIILFYNVQNTIFLNLHYYILFQFNELQIFLMHPMMHWHNANIVYNMLEKQVRKSSPYTNFNRIVYK